MSIIRYIFLNINARSLLDTDSNTSVLESIEYVNSMNMLIQLIC